jgi:antitoxin MazE
VKAKVQRWGNSLAVRIPKSFAEEVGLEAGTTVEMRLVDGGLLVAPAPDESLSLDDLLDGVTKANIHAEVDAGPSQGREVR